MATHYPILPISPATWESAQTFADYADSISTHQKRIRRLYKEVSVRREDAELVIGALFAPSDVDAAQSDARELRILVTTEDWCSDSAIVLPYLARLAEMIHLPIRVLRRDENPDLAEWYRQQGVASIPVVSVGTIESGDRFVELARWIERPQAATDRLEAWTGAHPRFRELSRRERDETRESEYTALTARLLHDMEVWYRDDGLWTTIAQELAAALAPGQD